MMWMWPKTYNFACRAPTLLRCFLKKNCRHISGGSKQTVGGLLNEWNKKFEENGISEPMESTEIIFAHVLGSKNLSHFRTVKYESLNSEQINKINLLCKRRLKKLPVQYIIGEWDFKDLNLQIKPPVFIPRPETEYLVDIATTEIAKRGASKILEVGCGSGAICLSILKLYPQIDVVAIDKSKEACELTESNARRNNIYGNLKIMNVALTNSNISTIFNEKFDIVVSNPPYVPLKDIKHLQPEIVLYEDIDALCGGNDGLDVIKLIIRLATVVLRNNGKLLLEVDTSHPQLLQHWLNQHSEFPLRYLRCHKDLFGKDRYVEIIYEKK